MNDFIFTCLALAGLSILWRKLLKDIPLLKKFISTTFGQALTCGICYTFWFAFLITIFINLLPGLNLIFRFSLPELLKEFFNFIIRWFALGFSAVFFRWVFLFLEDSHNIKKHIHKH